ncbi:hypothetical protein NLJ89_g2689 [Agrocybe chaxingu]|uniref:BTB domain-containing protein n=1 Tax=Agrocybe chaxingu TaxID=84603 RepID=A0A9W8MXY0_9AGAR|nr:hypothetical protein NLJ89_g2689 [Agrocybe chaxingu]
MSEPTAKRARLASDDGAATTSGQTSAGIIRSENFWLDDGNIILQAENTQFRVHKSMLARQSTIFKDMFSIPQPTKPLDPVIEGCPVVALSDKTSDVECMLSIFYDNNNVVDLENALPIDQLSAILSMGKKYEITYLRDRALKRLRRCFPVTLKEWDDSFGDANGPSISFEPMVDTIESVISLAHMHDISSILPGAYLFYLSQASPEEILRGDKKVLSQDTREQCILGRDGLIRRIQLFVNMWGNGNKFMPPASCTNAGQCSFAKADVLEMLIISLWLRDERTMWDLSPDIPPPASMIVSALCDSCSASIKTHYNKARERIWAELPKYFALPDWEELKDFDA